MVTQYSIYSVICQLWRNDICLLAVQLIQKWSGKIHFLMVVSHFIGISSVFFFETTCCHLWIGLPNFARHWKKQLLKLPQTSNSASYYPGKMTNNRVIQINVPIETYVSLRIKCIAMLYIHRAIVEVLRCSGWWINLEW